MCSFLSAGRRSRPTGFSRSAQPGSGSHRHDRCTPAPAPIATRNRLQVGQRWRRYENLGRISRPSPNRQHGALYEDGRQALRQILAGLIAGRRLRSGSGETCCGGGRQCGRFRPAAANAPRRGSRSRSRLRGTRRSPASIASRPPVSIFGKRQQSSGSAFPISAIIPRRTAAAPTAPMTRSATCIGTSHSPGRRWRAERPL